MTAAQKSWNVLLCIYKHPHDIDNQGKR